MRLPISHDTISTVFGVAYLLMVTNAALVLACAPLVFVLVTSDPAASWPTIAVLAPLVVPAAMAAFAVFADSTDGVVRTFVRTWRREARRGLAIGAAASVLVTVLALDIVYLFGSGAGAVATPAFVVLIALVLATALHAAVLVVDVPAVRLWDAVRWSAYLAVRRWYLTAVSFAVLGLFGLLFVAMPAIALGLAVTPFLYLVWANTRWALRPAFAEPPSGPRAVAT